MQGNAQTLNPKPLNPITFPGLRWPAASGCEADRAHDGFIQVVPEQGSVFMACWFVDFDITSPNSPWLSILVGEESPPPPLAKWLPESRHDEGSGFRVQGLEPTA